ncbi:ribosomal protection-like ABC-F family protein [Bacillus sp. T3]|uniref:ribosomal protection-like ABC-F family protein n=1 Tax=Bacillus sp. T3 TaxID=467262 RepID=UPI00298158F6|nr:ABC-F type ribosomal protection protein [Bacillus sp. T3]
MELIKMTGIEKHFGGKLLFAFDKFIVYKNDIIGVVGLNGSGKTTLLEIINGDIAPDKGMIEVKGDISYYKQFGQYQESAGSWQLREFHSSSSISEGWFSGGEKTRVRLAETFSKNSSILLLDEPTANLDSNGIHLLKRNLEKYNTIMIISHDTTLLDELCNRIIEIDNKTIHCFDGNYTAYKQQKELQIFTEKREYENYQAKKKHLEEAYLQKKKQAEAITDKPKNMSSSEIRARSFLSTYKSFGGRQKAIAKQAKAVQSRIKQLDVKEKVEGQAKIQINFELTNPPKNKILIRGEEITFGYDYHLILNNASFEIRNKQKVAVLGDNGSGKSTLFSLIRNKYEGIYTVPKLKIGYLYQEFENLQPDKTLLESVLVDSVQENDTVYTVLMNLLFSIEDFDKKVAVLSGGEKIRLSFAKLIVSDYNLLILDEPTNYLDLPSIEVIKSVLKEYEGTIIFASHDEAFINELSTELLIIDNKKLKGYQGTLDEFKNSKTEANIEHLQQEIEQFQLSQVKSLLENETNPRKIEKIKKKYEEMTREYKGE